MTDQEIQAAKSAVEAAQFGVFVPDENPALGQAEFAALHVAPEVVAPLEGKFLAAGESDNYVGKPTLQGSTK